jgi:hypothetical protein
MQSTCRRTFMARVAQVTVLLTALPILMAAPSSAFHNSELDPPTKQFLAGHIEKLQSQCDQGAAQACSHKEQLRALGNGLVDAERACAAGNQRACQARAALREQVASLAAPVEPKGGGVVITRPDGSRVTLQSPPCTRAMGMEILRLGMPPQDLQEILNRMCGGQLRG